MAAAWPNTFKILFSSQEVKVFRLGDFFLFFVKSVVLRVLYETTIKSDINQNILFCCCSALFINKCLIICLIKWKTCCGTRTFIIFCQICNCSVTMNVNLKKIKPEYIQFYIYHNYKNRCFKTRTAKHKT